MGNNLTPEKFSEELMRKIIKSLQEQLITYTLLLLGIIVLVLTKIWPQTMISQLLAMVNLGVLGIGIGLKLAEISKWRLIQKNRS